MSQLRHCDVGNHDFSIRQEGWGSARITWHNRYQDGSPNDLQDEFDICSQHGAQWRGASQPSNTPIYDPTVTNGKAIESAPGIEVPPGKKVVDAEEYSRYVEWLEKDTLGDLDGDT